MKVIDLGEFLTPTIDEKEPDENKRETERLCNHFLTLLLEGKNLLPEEVDRMRLTRQNMMAYLNKDFADARNDLIFDSILFEIQKTETYFVFYRGNRIIESRTFSGEHYQGAVEWFRSKGGNEKRFAVKYKASNEQRMHCEIGVDIKGEDLLLTKD